MEEKFWNEEEGKLNGFHILTVYNQGSLIKVIPIVK